MSFHLSAVAAFDVSSSIVPLKQRPDFASQPASAWRQAATSLQLLQMRDDSKPECWQSGLHLQTSGIKPGIRVSISLAASSSS